MRGLKRGLAGGLLLAIIVFFLPDSLLGGLTVGTGLASVLPAAAPPLGMKARLLLAVVALLIGFALTFWLVRRSRPSWDVDDSSFDDEPLPAYEQMVVSPGPPASDDAAPPTPSAARQAVPSDIDARLARIEAALAAMSKQSATATDQPALAGDVLTRLETLEAKIGERLAAIEARLDTPGVDTSVEGARPLRASPGVGRKLADIRRSLDGA